MAFDGLKRWHGRMGVLSAFFVLLLAFTGLCLNHVSSWGFDSKALRSPFLLSLYGMAEAGTVVSYPLADAFISESNGQLFYQDREIARCEGALVGAVAVVLNANDSSPKNTSYIVVACEEQLLLFSPTVELIEKIGPAFGLPKGLKRAGLLDGRLFLETNNASFFADLNALRWTAAKQGDRVDSTQWSEAGRAPESLRLALAEQIDSENISYERLLLDIHSGRIFGEWGIYLMDAMALLFMLLAISGLVIWMKGKKT